MAETGSTDCIVVLTTLGTLEEARTLVRRLVEQRLVACGTILDRALSIYRWKGEIQESTEAVVLLKTRRELWNELLQAVEALHPYEVPELLQLPVDSGLERYLDWLKAETLTAEERTR